MSILNQYNYYVNHTDIFYDTIKKFVDKTISNSRIPQNCFLDNCDFSEITTEIITSLKRVVTTANSYPFVTESDKQDTWDEISSIQRDISKHIVNEFVIRGYKVTSSEDGVLRFSIKY